jgi:hypothetical protein
MHFMAQGLVTAMLLSGCIAAAQNRSPTNKSWIEKSNQYTQLPD